MRFNETRPVTWRLMLVAAALAAGGCATTTETTSSLPPAEVQPVATPQPAPAAKELQAFDANGNPYVPGTQRLLTTTFYFDYDRSVLKPESLSELEMHAETLRAHPDRTIVIEGHADERGSREYNLALGERRANAVRAFLLAAGVASRQIQTVSYGEERPENAGNGESAWSRNRRAMIDYSGGPADHLADIR